MDNLYFNNNISVTITKSPENPIEGDDVTFTASAVIDQPTSAYTNDSTYFFSYQWMESQDGGVTYYQVGQDLETLTIPNISKTFFNNLYKVQVALIDLENIILTEDGDNLTTQFGEILIGNNISTNMSIQSTNNTKLSDAPLINANLEIKALDIVNLDSIIDEALIYDTTLNDVNKAIVYGGQITINKDNTSQIISGTEKQEISIPELTDPTIEIGANQLSISADGCDVEVHTPISCATVRWCKNTPPCDQVCEYPKREVVGTAQNFKRITAESIFGNTYEYSCCPSEYNTISEAGPAACDTSGAKAVYQERKPTLQDGKIYPMEGIDEKLWDWKGTGGGGAGTLYRFPRIEYGTEAELDKKCGTDQGRKTTLVDVKSLIKDKDNILVTADVIILGVLIGTFTGLFLLTGMGTVAIGAGFVIDVVATGAYVWYAGTKTDLVPVLHTQKYQRYYNYAWECFLPVSKTSIVLSPPVFRPSAGDSFLPYEADIVFKNWKPERVAGTPSYSCDEGCSVDIAPAVDSDSCEWVVVKQCGPPNISCRCTLNDGGLDRKAHGLKPTYDFKIKNNDPDLLFKGSGPLKDCVNIAESCGATCTGINCCGQATTIWDIASSAGSVVCNEYKKLFSANTANGSPDIYWEACPDSTDTSLDIIIVTITERFANCEEKPSGSSFTDVGQAQAYILSLVGDKIGLAVQFRLQSETDISKWTEYATIRTTDQGYQKLYMKNKSFYNGHKWLNKDCDACSKEIYQLNMSNSSYPCYDTLYCGTNLGNCNIQSLDSTEITLATIDQIEKPTKEQVVQAKKSMGGYFKTLADAQASALLRIAASGKPGIVTPSRCPD